MSANLTTSEISVDRLLRHAADGFFVLDRGRRFVVFNEACEGITGYKSTELVSTECHCSDTLGCQDEYGRPLSAALCPVKELFGGTIDAARQRMRVRRRDGKLVWIETVYTPIRDAAGKVEYVLGAMRDVTETKAKEEGLLEELSRLRKNLPSLAGDRRSETDLGATAAESTTEGPATRLGTPLSGERSAFRTGAPSSHEALRLDPVLASVEREAIRRALQAANWQRNKAARLMGISRSRLYRRMDALGIDPNAHT